MEKEKKPNFYTHRSYATNLGTALRFFLMTLILFGMAGFTRYLFATTALQQMGLSIMIVSLVIGVAFAFLITFKKMKGAIFAPLFVFFQGIFVGCLSYSATQQSPGIVTRVLLANYLIMLLMLMLFKFDIVDTGEKFKRFVKYSTLTVIGYYFISMLLYFIFDIDISLVRTQELHGQFFSAIVVIIVSLTYLVDFDLIQKFCHLRADRYMQWYGGFICMISFVWLSVELYHLFLKL